jgi:hypothetical protein
MPSLGWIICVADEPGRTLCSLNKATFCVSHEPAVFASKTETDRRLQFAVDYQTDRPVRAVRVRIVGGVILAGEE